jgi:hypothetical protein
VEVAQLGFENAIKEFDLTSSAAPTPVDLPLKVASLEKLASFRKPHLQRRAQSRPSVPQPLQRIRIQHEQILTLPPDGRAQDLLAGAAASATDDSATNKQVSKTGRAGKDLRAPKGGGASIKFDSTGSKISSKPSPLRRNPSHPEMSKPHLGKLRPPTLFF